MTGVYGCEAELSSAFVSSLLVEWLVKIRLCFCWVFHDVLQQTLGVVVKFDFSTIR